MIDEKGAPKFRIGDRVTKTKGSSWTGRVVGTYSTALTPEGYAVESETETGSVQIYPAAALTAYLSARSAEPVALEALMDKIEGLESDLTSAVEVAYRRGAVEWVRLNYPRAYAVLSAHPKEAPDV